MSDTVFASGAFQGRCQCPRHRQVGTRSVHTDDEIVNACDFLIRPLATAMTSKKMINATSGGRRYSCRSCSSFGR